MHVVRIDVLWWKTAIITTFLAKSDVHWHKMNAVMVGPFRGNVRPRFGNQDDFIHMEFSLKLSLQPLD